MTKERSVNALTRRIYTRDDRYVRVEHIHTCPMKFYKIDILFVKRHAFELFRHTSTAVFDSHFSDENVSFILTKCFDISLFKRCDSINVNVSSACLQRYKTTRNDACKTTMWNNVPSICDLLSRGSQIVEQRREGNEICWWQSTCNPRESRRICIIRFNDKRS